MAWQLVLCVAFTSLAILSVRQLVRARDSLSMFLVLIFSAIAIIEIWATAWLIVGTKDLNSVPYQIGARAVFLLLVFYPWALYQFSAVASGKQSRFGKHAAIAVLIPLGLFVMFAPFALPPISAGYAAVIAVFKVGVALQFLLCSSIASVKLWKTGRVQPPIVKKRLRMMSVAATLLSLALIIGAFGGSAATRSLGIELAFGITALMAAAAFYLCLAPPKILRVYWTYSAVRAVRVVVQDVMSADSRSDAVAQGLPIMAEMAGSNVATAYDTEDRVLAKWPTDWTPRPDDLGDTERITIPMESEGRIELQRNALWPFVGPEEKDLLQFVGSSLGLALVRRRLDDANAQIRVQSAVERSLRVQATELERANRELNEFVAIASHDLQTPVRNIIDNVEFLEEDMDTRTQLSDEARQDLAFIAAGAHRIKTLIDGLLHYTRIGSLSQVQSETVDLNDLFRQVSGSLNTELTEVDASMTVAPLPHVSGQFSELGEVFVNLIDNSVKYRSPDRRLKIAVTPRVGSAGQVAILVSDNGIGIPPEFRERVFEMFKRLHSYDEIDGTGIGLAVCRKIVERLGGQIFFVEPEFGVGTTVKITFPVAERGHLESVA